MRSEWRQWPSEARVTWRIPGGEAVVIYALLGGTVENDDGTWSPVEFTYVERPDDKLLPYIVVECAYSRADLVPRVIAVHVLSRHPEREVNRRDLELSLAQVIEDAWKRITRRPRVVVDEPVDLAKALTDIGGPDPATLRGLRKRARQRLTDETLEEVADVYRRNLPTGKQTKAVREHFGIAESTAASYVKKARDAGKKMTEDNNDEGAT